MINRKDLKDLRSGKLPEILLPDGYILRLDDYNKIFISRGGKRRYYLSDKFLSCLCSRNTDSSNMKLFIFIIKGIEEIAKRLKKESNTRVRLEKLLSEIKNKYE